MYSSWKAESGDQNVLSTPLACVLDSLPFEAAGKDYEARRAELLILRQSLSKGHLHLLDMLLFAILPLPVVAGQPWGNF